VEDDVNMNKNNKMITISFMTLLIISIASIGLSIQVALASSSFTSQCNDHWQEQIERVCAPSLNQWEHFNNTAPFPIKDINQQFGR